MIAYFVSIWSVFAYFLFYNRRLLPSPPLQAAIAALARARRAGTRGATTRQMRAYASAQRAREAPQRTRAKTRVFRRCCRSLIRLMPASRFVFVDVCHYCPLRYYL